MLDPALTATPAVVVLALAAAAAWGTSDFGGGFLGRRGPLLGVLVMTQGVGLCLAVGLSVIRHEPGLAGPDLALSVVGGLLAVVGIGGLYGGLAMGRMAVVAPVAAVLSALTPALLGLALEGLPQPVVLAGMAIAILAVVMVSRVADHPGEDRPSGLWLAVISGLALGILSFLLSRIDDAYLFAPLAALRAVQFVVFGTVVVLGRRAWRLPRSTWRLAIGVGVVDLLGNAAFLIAARVELAPAAVVSSLYPVVTVVLAATILGERITRSHAAGIILAAVGVMLIAGGANAGT